jgi:hypothetical protein
MGASGIFAGGGNNDGNGKGTGPSPTPSELYTTDGGSIPTAGSGIAKGTDPSENKGTGPSFVGTGPSETLVVDAELITLSSKISKNIGSISVSPRSVAESCDNPYIKPATNPA